MQGVGKMIERKVICICFAIVVSLMVPSLTAVNAGGIGDGSVDVIDVNGDPVHLDGPATKVAALGVGIVKTIMDLRCDDKIVGVDHYSSADYTGNSDFAAFENLGNYYTPDGREEILLRLIQMMDDGDFEHDDLVILAPNYSYISGGASNDLLHLNEAGANFKIIEIVSSSLDYDGVVNMVNNIGLILGSPNAEYVVENMIRTKTLVSSMVGDTDTKVPAIHMSSAATPTFYNRSILLSMVSIAGGSNAGDNGSAAASHAESMSAIAELLEEHGRLVIFLDAGNPNSAAQIRSQLDDHPGLTVVKMQPDWNNTCPAITDGLIVVAFALHSGSDGMLFDTDRDNDNGWYVYIVAAVVVAAAAGIAMLFILRRN